MQTQTEIILQCVLKPSAITHPAYMTGSHLIWSVCRIIHHKTLDILQKLAVMIISEMTHNVSNGMMLKPSWVNAVDSASVSSLPVCVYLWNPASICLFDLTLYLL